MTELEKAFMIIEEHATAAAAERPDDEWSVTQLVVIKRPASLEFSIRLSATTATEAWKRTFQQGLEA